MLLLQRQRNRLRAARAARTKSRHTNSSFPKSHPTIVGGSFSPTSTPLPIAASASRRRASLFVHRLIYRVIYMCRTCGIPCRRRRGTRATKYCSRLCSYRGRLRPRFHICRVCHRPFESLAHPSLPGRTHGKCPKCHQNALPRTQHRHAAPACAWCHEPMLFGPWPGTEDYCSPLCRDRGVAVFSGQIRYSAFVEQRRAEDAIRAAKEALDAYQGGRRAYAPSLSARARADLGEML